METLPILALALLAGGYAVLAGCDVGLGMLLPQLARTPAERRRLVAAAAPYFLGTEVWLVAAIGLAAGAFPDLKAAVAGPLWPVFTALAAAWIVRDAGLWLHARSAGRTWRAACEAAITAGSWVLAACWGAAVAGLLTGSAPTSPFAIACAALVVVLVLLRGAAFGAERLAGAGAPESGAGADSAARLTRWLARAGLVALALAAAAALLPGGPDAERPLLLAGAAVLAAGALAATAGLGGPARSRHASAAALAALLPALAAVPLPLGGAGGPSAVLIAVAVAPLLPLMVAGQVALYRMLRRPVRESGFFAAPPPPPPGAAPPGPQQLPRAPQAPEAPARAG